MAHKDQQATIDLPVGISDKQDLDPFAKPDWTRKCTDCGESPVLPPTGLCGSCTFGSIRINEINIKNYKSIDSLHLPFAIPSYPDELDIYVLGSKNGVGKSSVLECCALAFSRQVPDFYRTCIRREWWAAHNQVTLSMGGDFCTVSTNLTAIGKNSVTYIQGHNLPDLENWGCNLRNAEDEIGHSILGSQNNPLIRPPLLFFQSCRTVSDNTIVNECGFSRHPEAVVDEVLKGLFKDFAGMRDAKPWHLDGLGSGQREIIATLFLIWSTTRHRPSIVLIDEPELHLNAEWQRIYVSKLAELAPNNQYILATHSEEIFASVTKDRRIILSK